jgi:hypothetical protein
MSKTWKIDLSVGRKFMVPVAVLEAAESQLMEIARGLSLIAADNPFWHSMSVSGLIIEVRRWRFEYRFDEPRARIEVLGVTRSSRDA